MVTHMLLVVGGCHQTNTLSDTVMVHMDLNFFKIEHYVMTFIGYSQDKLTETRRYSTADR